MSSRFYRRLTLFFLISALLLNSVFLIGLVLFEGRVTIASIILVLLVALAIVTAVLGMKADNKLSATLKEAMGRLAAGGLGNRLPVKKEDEWGKIYQAFNEMSVNLDWMVSRLSEDRLRLQTILSTMTDGVIMTDKDGNVILANPAAERFFGFKREKCPGCPLIQIIGDHEVDALLKQCIKEKKQQSIPFESRQAKQFFQIFAYPLFAERLTGVLLLFQDLTEVRNLQAVRREFIANVSHEFKTPLAGKR
jgi:two-component system phosphate regulon sensor histidine kinase PhoR